MGKWSEREWPEETLRVLSWYAMNDPDPDKELWNTRARNDQPYYQGDPYTAGINSTRGSTASAIADLLFASNQRYETFKEAIASVVGDRSIAVRSCALAPLLAMLNIERTGAITLFHSCISLSRHILRAPHVQHFLFRAGIVGYMSIRNVLQSMLESTEEALIECAAYLTCLLSLSIDEATIDAERVAAGSAVMRRSAAKAYARGIGDQSAGEVCRTRIKRFFADSDETVRSEASSAFQQLHTLNTSDQSDLLRAFLDCNPSAKALETVIRVLEDSPVQLPDLVCRVIELSVSVFRDEGGNISKAGAAVAMDLSKILVRLYSQTRDPEIQSRCLSQIDEMERHNFYGLSDELRLLDR
jgi:hypothetical protein